MSKLLLDENPLIVLPQLAVKIGLNEAIFIQQIHYWLQKSKNVINGHKWTYNSYEKLQEQFPFFSTSTIKRIIKNLKEKELLIVDNFNKDSRNKTNWYAINYTKFDALMDSSDVTDALGQSEPMDKVNLNQSDRVNLTQCIKVKSLTETTTENSTEKKNIKKDFSFSLKLNIQFENLSEEYKSKLKAYAVTKDGSYSFEDFLNYHIAKGSKFKDWSRAYNTWLSNSAKFGGFNSKDHLYHHHDPVKDKYMFKDFFTNDLYCPDELRMIATLRVREPIQEQHQPTQDNSVQVNNIMQGLVQRMKV